MALHQQSSGLWTMQTGTLLGMHLLQNSSNNIKLEYVDLKRQDQDWWWHQLAHAQIIIGWYVHGLLSGVLNESMLEMLVKHRAAVLLGCPVAGPCFFAEQKGYSGPTLKVTPLGEFGEGREDSCFPGIKLLVSRLWQICCTSCQAFVQCGCSGALIQNPSKNLSQKHHQAL